MSNRSDPRAGHLLAELHAQLDHRRRAALARSAILTLAALGLTAWLTLGAARPSFHPAAITAAPVESPAPRYAYVEVVRNAPALLARWSIRCGGRVEAVGDRELGALLTRSGDGVVRVAGRSRLIAYASPNP